MKRFKDFYEMAQFNAENSGNFPAFKFKNAGKVECITFSDFFETIKSRTHKLKAEGKTCEGIICDGSFDCVAEIFASALAGQQTVLLDGDAEKEELEKLIKRTDVDKIFTKNDELKKFFESRLTPGVKNGAHKVLFFTSGTTDSSKAVVLTDSSLCASAYNGSCMLGLKKSDTLLCVLPLSHVFGFICSMLWAFSCGACVALGGGMRGLPFDCATFKPTAISVVPMLLGFYLQKKLFNPELKTILVGAGDCPDVLLEAAKKAGYKVSFGYGLTETSSGVAISTGGNPRAMDICPDDEITIAPDGEILIKAPTCIMQGYYKNKKATDEVLKNGILYTGDIGKFDSDGKLHITGRKKEMIVLSSGVKIFLPEYEENLRKILQNPELAVILTDGRLILVCHTESETAEDVKTRISEFMKTQPKSKQIDEIFITPNNLPKTKTGKIKRKEVENIYKIKDGETI